jgi:hypothetical protein
VIIILMPSGAAVWWRVLGVVPVCVSLLCRIGAKLSKPERKRVVKAY